MRRKTMCWPTGAARVIAPLVLLLLLCLAPAYSYGATIFTEGFETGAPGTTGWATSGTVNWYTGTPKNGTHSVQLGRNGTLQRTISTQGYDTIAVSFYLGASFASSNQSVRVRYTTNGFTWTTLVTLTTTTAWASYGPYSLPASAADNDNFALRCEAASSSGANYGYIDDVLVTGNPKSYALNLTGTGGTVNVNGVNYALPWSGTFIYGTAVTLQAVPNAHYQFSSWSGDLRSHSNPTTVTINQQYDITVNFQIQQCTLSIPNATGGSVSVNGRSQRLPYQDTFDYGSSITLQATANSGYAFSGWTGDLTSSANPVTITITDDMSITANFTVVPTTLTISGSHGSVQVNGGAASPLPWSGGFAYGTRVTVVAVPDVGYHFVQWTGDASGTRTTVRIRMLGDRNVTAVFAPNQYQLSLSGSGGQVSVNGTPQTLPWSGMFDYGTTVTLTALPTPPGQFTGWSGDLTGTANPASVLIDGAKNITANFTVPQYQLSLTGSNGGVKVNGTLQALPWSGSFSAGTVVTLEAVANTHYHFTGWSGDLTGTTSPTSITMDGAKNITAGFAIDQFQLSLTIGSHGGVKVNGTLQTGSYTGTFDYGTVVTLEAVSNAHCHFTGWSGDLTGTTSPTSITMDG
ncbi:MAG: InlB B-repeat-containing protein, partial [Armatimonadota bacterium]